MSFLSPIQLIVISQAALKYALKHKFQENDSQRRFLQTALFQLQIEELLLRYSLKDNEIGA